MHEQDEHNASDPQNGRSTYRVKPAYTGEFNDDPLLAHDSFEDEVYEEPEDAHGGDDTDTSIDDAEQETSISQMSEAPPSVQPVTETASVQEIAGIRDRVVMALLRKNVVTIQQVRQAQRIQKQHPKEALWRILAVQPNVDREAIYAETARIYAFAQSEVGDGRPDAEFVRTVLNSFPQKQREKLIKLRILPFDYELERKSGMIKLVFLTHDPTHPEMTRLMRELDIERFELRYAAEASVSAILDELYPRKNEFLERMNEDPMALDLGASYEVANTGLIDEEALEAEISRSSLINLFEATLVEAVRLGVSDVHIFPNGNKQTEFHFRLDGRLQRWHLEEKVHPEAMLAVIKDNAINVDRFERDAAQDGFIQRWIDETLIRFRVSVLPIASASHEIRAESIVIRVLDDRKVITDLHKLGLLPTAMARFNKAIRQPHGMVILTGPTGSGKSTTLVAALHQVVTPEVNVLTVEDPVEYMIRGVRQIKLSHKLDLEGALRAILRHDPDIVMVGEMRDRLTAELAIKLANTGHLTFSTLHTNDAASAVSRLFKMGIEPFLIAYAINLVVAQRLLRTLCPQCKRVDQEVDTVLAEQLGFSVEEIESTKFYVTGTDSNCRGCKGRGYKGRRAITEALYFSPAIRKIIVEAGDVIEEDAITQTAVKEGMLTLSASAREYIRLGETSLEEMLRVTASDD